MFLVSDQLIFIRFGKVVLAHPSVLEVMEQGWNAPLILNIIGYLQRCSFLDVSCGYTLEGTFTPGLSGPLPWIVHSVWCGVNTGTDQTNELWSARNRVSVHLQAGADPTLQRGRGLVVGPYSLLASSLVNNSHYGSDLDPSRIWPLPKRDWMNGLSFKNKKKLSQPSKYEIKP